MQFFCLCFPPVRGRGPPLQFSWLHTNFPFCGHQRQEDPTRRPVLPLIRDINPLGDNLGFGEMLSFTQSTGVSYYTLSSAPPVLPRATKPHHPENGHFHPFPQLVLIPLVQAEFMTLNFKINTK